MAEDKYVANKGAAVVFACIIGSLAIPTIINLATGNFLPFSFLISIIVFAISCLIPAFLTRWSDNKADQSGSGVCAYLNSLCAFFVFVGATQAGMNLVNPFLWVEPVTLVGAVIVGVRLGHPIAIKEICNKARRDLEIKMKEEQTMPMITWFAWIYFCAGISESNQSILLEKSSRIFTYYQEKGWFPRYFILENYIIVNTRNVIKFPELPTRTTAFIYERLKVSALLLVNLEPEDVDKCINDILKKALPAYIDSLAIPTNVLQTNVQKRVLVEYLINQSLPVRERIRAVLAKRTEISVRESADEIQKKHATLQAFGEMLTDLTTLKPVETPTSIQDSIKDLLGEFEKWQAQ